MDFVNDVLGAMHLPGLNFLETVGAGAALYLGVVACKFALGFASQMLSRARSMSREPAASGRRR